jgi:hypothetical protein
MIFTNPSNPSEYFNTEEKQTQGKPKKWLSEHPEYIAWRNQKLTQKTVPKIEQNTTLNVWKYVGLIGDDVRDDFVKTHVLIAAKDPMNALHILNKRFKEFPVSMLEFKTMWRLVTNASITVEGFYEMKDNILTMTVQG